MTRGKSRLKVGRRVRELATWRLTEPRRGWVRWTWTVPAPHLRPSLPPELEEIPGIIVREVSALEGYVEAHESTFRVPVVDAWRGELATAPRTARVFAVMPVLAARPLFPHQREAVDVAVNSTSGILFADEMGLGKGLVYGTRVLTPTGWTNVECLRVGDTVTDPDTGCGALVLGVYAQPEQSVYDVAFSDHTSLRVDGPHLWHVLTPNDRIRGGAGRVCSTEDLLRQPLRGTKSKLGWTNRRWFIPVAAPVQFVPIAGDRRWPAYALGALLGDGSFRGGCVRFTKPDVEIHERLGALVALGEVHVSEDRCPTRTVLGGAAVAQALGLLDLLSYEKHIPAHYLRDSVDARIELLRGLMDTDGDCTRGGVAVFNTSSEKLQLDVVELVRGLGGIATVSTKLAPKFTHRGETRVGHQAWRVNVRVPFNPFHVTKKASRWRAPNLARGIESITPAGRAPTVCIRVASARQLFVAGDHIVTHNSVVGGVAARTRACNGKILIVAPKYLRGTWMRELTALGVLDDPQDFVALETLDNGKHDDAMRRARWWFCHWDILEAWASRINFNLTGKRPAAVIFDEAHAARNPRTKRGSAMGRVAGGVPFRMVLTGTPHVTRPSDLWNQLTAVDGPGSWGTLYAFRKRYCGAVHGEYGFHDTEPTNTEEFRVRLEGRYLARTKAEVGLSLPPLLRSLVDVEKRPGFDDELKGLLRHYHVSSADIVNALQNGGAPGELVLRALHALRKHTSEAKRRATCDLLSDIVESGQSALVFVQERAQAEWFDDHADVGPNKAFLHGGVDDAQREHLLEWFQKGLVDGKPRVLFATYGALREGVTLTAASHVVLHDLDWTPSVIFQAEARAHRLGLRHSVTSHWMTLVDSIDTLFAQALLRKAREQRELLAASAGADALEDLALVEAAGGLSVEDDAQRLIDSWGGASW